MLEPIEIKGEFVETEVEPTYLEVIEADIEIDAEFTETYVEPTYLETVLEYIKSLEKSWRDSRNFYLADAASQLAEAINIYRQESEK